MTIEEHLRNADPARRVEIPRPDSPEGRTIEARALRLDLEMRAGFRYAGDVDGEVTLGIATLEPGDTIGEARRLVGSLEVVTRTMLVIDMRAERGFEADTERSGVAGVLDAIVRAAVVRHQGDIGNERGYLYGSYQATFNSAKSAVHSAAEIIADAHRAGLDDLRAGIHNGVVKVGDYAVERLEAVAIPICLEAELGQVLVSESVRNALLGTGIEFTSQGEYELRVKPPTGPRRLYALAATSSLVRDKSSEPADSVLASTVTGRETFTDLDLNELAEDALNSSEPLGARRRAAVRGIRLSIDRGGEVPIFGEPTLLHRLLGKLLSNAIGFSPRGARVHVIVDTAGSFGRVQVLDEGPGIPDNEREHFFERRRPGDFSGATTRLSLAASIAQANQGFIDIVDTPGWSTTFRVYIPLRGSVEAASKHTRPSRSEEDDDRKPDLSEDMAYDDGILHVDFARSEVTIDGSTVDLRPEEYIVLSTLVRHHGQTVSLDELITAIWGDDATGAATKLKYLILLLHRKLGQEVIETVGDGYRYRAR